MNFWQIFGICALLAVGVASVVFLFIKIPFFKVLWKKAITLTLACVVLMVSTFFLGTATTLLSTSFPNLVDAYNDYGFPYLASVVVLLARVKVKLDPAALAKGRK